MQHPIGRKRCLVLGRRRVWRSHRHSASISVITVRPQAVWPDWVIFKGSWAKKFTTKVAQIFLLLIGYIKKHCSYRKNSGGCFLATFGNLGYFLYLHLVTMATSKCWARSQTMELFMHKHIKKIYALHVSNTLIGWIILISQSKTSMLNIS